MSKISILEANLYGISQNHEIRPWKTQASSQSMMFPPVPTICSPIKFYLRIRKMWPRCCECRCFWRKSFLILITNLSPHPLFKTDSLDFFLDRVILTFPQDDKQFNLLPSLHRSGAIHIFFLFSFPCWNYWKWFCNLGFHTEQHNSQVRKHIFN